LTKKIELVYKIIEFGGESYTAGINNNLKTLNNHIGDLKKASDQSIAAFSSQLQIFTSSISLNIEESVSNITSKAENIFQAQQDAIRKNLLDLSDLNSKILFLKEEISKTDFQAHLNFVDENFQKYSSKTTEQIFDASRDAKESMEKAIDKSHNSQIENNLLLNKKAIESNNELRSFFQALVKKNNDEINSKLELRISELEKQTKINSYVTWAIIVIAAIAQLLL